MESIDESRKCESSPKYFEGSEDILESYPFVVGKGKKEKLDVKEVVKKVIEKRQEKVEEESKEAINDENKENEAVVVGESKNVISVVS